MSIEWNRIFPKSTASVDISNEGGTVSLADLKALDALANQDEVKHYRDVFAPTTPALERTPKPTQHQGHQRYHLRQCATAGPAGYVHPERRLALLLLFHRLLDFIDADLAHRLPQ